MQFWKNLANWEKHLVSIARQCIIDNPIGIRYLYLTLSNKAADWIKNKQHGIYEGATFYVPVEDGNKYKFTFYSNTTQVELVNDNTGKSEVFISANSSAEREYEDLQVLERYINVSGTKLGYAPSEKWRDFLKKIKVGDTITFEGAHTYCCLKVKNDVLTLIETFTGNPKDITPTTFDSIKTVKIDINSPLERKLLFSKNKYDVMGFALPKITEGTFAQQELNKLVHELKKGRTKVMHWGPISIAVKNNLIKSGYSWYVNGHKADETIVKMMLGYFNNAPTSTEFLRDTHDTLTDFQDLDCLNAVKECCAKTEYLDAFHTIQTHVQNNKESVSVNLQTFEPDKNGNYFAVGFVFKHENNKVNVYKIQYENNDFNKDAINIKQTNAEGFVTFCEKINEHNRAYWLEEMNQRYDLTNPTPTQKRIINKTLDTKTYNNPIINENNLKSYIPLDSLIASLKNTPKEDAQDAGNKILRIFNEER